MNTHEQPEPADSAHPGTSPQTAEEYRQLIESFAQAFWETDAAGQVVKDSLSWRAYTGQTLEQWLGEGWTAAVHPDDRSYALSQWQKAVETQTPVDAEFRLRSAQGGWRWTNVRATPIRNPDGAISKWMGLNIDIAEKKQPEEALSKSEEKYRTLFNSIDEGFVIGQVFRTEDGTVDYRYQTVNPAWERIMGLNAEEIVGRTAREVLPGLNELWYETLERVGFGGESTNVEEFVTPIGKWLETSFSPITPMGEGWLSVLEKDVTGRKQYEQQQAYLLTLSDALRSIADPMTIEQTVTQLAIQQFDADRCYYCRIEAGNAIITHDAMRGDLLPVAGTYPLSSFALLKKVVDEGKPFVVNDATTSPILDEPIRALCLQLSVISFINVPIIKNGNAVGVWCLVQSVPRTWTAVDVLLAIETAERTWAAVERARAEEALARSEEKYRTLFNSIDEGFAFLEVMYDECGGPVDLLHRETNPAYQKLSTLGDLAGRPFRIREFVPNLEQWWFDFYAGVARTGESVRAEYYVDAIKRWFTVYASRVGGEGSHLVVAVFDDITERRRQERYQTYQLTLSDALRPLANAALIEGESIRILGEALHTNRVFYAWIEADGDTGEIRQDYVNGIPSGVGRYSISAFAPEFMAEWRAGRTAMTADVTIDPRFTDAARAAYASVSSRSAVGVPLLKEGRLIALLGVNQATPREWTDEEVSLIQETLERMWAASERARAEEALKEADRRKDEFLAMLAHELRNPMATIRNGIGILELTNEPDSMTGQTVSMMNRQVDHLVRMVDDLLDVSRISRGKIELKRERLELGALVAGALEAIQSAYTDQHKSLQLSPATVPLFVNGDTTRLAQVVTNLLTNGLRYTGQQGQVRVSVQAENGEAVLRVADNGIGLSADQRTTIFELFVQVDNSLARSQGGLGVGLTLAKRLVEMHGGRVEAHSPGLGQGSEFLVYLPLLEEPKQEKTVSTMNDSKAISPRILVIDDNADAALTLSMLLKLKGYEVHSRHSGREGIQAIEELIPAIILCDIGMPEMDGYETARRIRQQPWGQKLILVALTGYGQEEDKQRAKEAGFDEHLVKPVKLDELQNVLTTLLATGQKTSGSDQ